MRLIVGLGNPETKYALTRHNVGFWVVDFLAEALDLTWENIPKLKSLVAKNADVVLLKPQTYMNLSGEAVVSATHFFKTSHTWVVCDDITIDLGTLRMRASGSAGGHNGLKNIIQMSGTEDFARYKVGVGPQPEQMLAEHFVLAKLAGEELDKLKTSAQKTAERILSDQKKDKFTEETIYF